MQDFPFEPPPDLPPTFFAPADRQEPAALREVMARVSGSPILGSVLELLGGWVAVLNQQRQILAVNHALLHALGIERPEEVLGLRPGEALKCVHANDHPGGCGTSRFCSTCGAAIAIVASLENHSHEQRECILSYVHEGQVVDRAFIVQARPVQIDRDSLLLICMRDVSDEKRRASLERVFLHDVSSLLTAIRMSTASLRVGTKDAELLDQIRQTVGQIIREVRVQKLLAQEAGFPSLELESVRPNELVNQLCASLAGHPAARNQMMEVIQPVELEPLETDPGLLSRVLTNMVLNALEAGREGDRVRLGAVGDKETVEFSVWNRAVIPAAATMRIFQQYFSTKSGAGRGLGTYSMKLLGETVLGGTVSFTSTPEEGTTFRIRLPRAFGNLLSRNFI